jgi:3'-phosphoadenosine 5'-phosphosulfate sulfotransferase (PAPS reductase)/FAD synthetase
MSDSTKSAEGEQVRLIPGRDPGAVIAEAIAKHDPSKAFVLFSGGKDSSVTLDYLWRNHREIVTGALHIDTGIGLRSTRDFARAFCEERDIPFHQAHAPLEYEDIVLNHGFPGPSAHGLMYSWLKERALRAFVGVNKRGNERVMLLTGVRAEESRRRMGTCVDIQKDGSKVWVAPLIDWGAREMQEHRTFYSVPMSPASSTIHISAECLCGAYGDPSELSLIGALYDDPVVARIHALEAKMEALGSPRCKWATPIVGDAVTTEAPGPLCIGCYKQPTLPLEDVA